MSVEYYYMNDLNTLYNASVGDKTDGGEHHMKMMVAHDNLEAYMQKMEHWRDTALQLSRNNGEAQAKIYALEADYVISNRELLVKQVEIQRLTARIAELEAENDRLQSGWFRDETICPDGSLRPKVSTLLSRIAELEAEVTKCHELQDSYCDRIAELEAALTNARELVGMTPPPAFPEWIPVTAKLPEDGETVFVIIHDGFERFENGNEVARLTYLGNGNWWSWESERYVVTHWMPLPNPPEVQE